MPLSPQLLYCAARVIATRREEIEGEVIKWRGPVGTAFCVTVPSEAIAEVSYGYVLTAHHVIDGVTDIAVQMAVPWEPGELYPEVLVTDWRQPDKKLDLAFARYAPPKDHSVPALAMGDHIIEGLEPSLGAQFYFVGLLAPLDRPMARSGTLGALDQTGLPLAPYDYPAHLGDCRSYGGFSGSPCFVEYPIVNLTPLTPEQRITLPKDKRDGNYGSLSFMHLFCGMFTAHLTTAPPERELVSRYGVGVLLRSDEICEVLMSDELKNDRRRIDEAVAAGKAKTTPKLVPASTPSVGQEFAQFEELTRRLVHVPKKELDEKRREDG